MSLLATLPRPVRILDVGGTERFWEAMRYTGAPDVEIVLLNLEAPAPTRHSNLHTVTGDATRIVDYGVGEFDVVFSNSVIEHVGGFYDQRRMAEEIRRVGKRYFVQTPNRYFPIEPHFLFPFFQFLPTTAKEFLAWRLSLGWYGSLGEREQVQESARTIRLLSRRELTQLFPGGTLYEERLLGIAKSFVVYGGWDASGAECDTAPLGWGGMVRSNTFHLDSESLPLDVQSASRLRGR